jgi:hypothetical protein
LDGGNTTSKSFRQILTDFELNLEGTNGILTRGIQNYNTSSEFRTTDLSGQTGLKTIDLQIFYQGIRGTLSPLILKPNSYFSMKMMFRLKK